MTHAVRPIASPDIARQPTFACSSNSAPRRLHLVGGRFARLAVTTSASALLFYQLHPRGLPDRLGRRQPTVASPLFLLSGAPCSPVSPARGAAPLLLHPARAVREARASADASAGCLACVIVTLPSGHSLPRAEMSRSLRIAGRLLLQFDAAERRRCSRAATAVPRAVADRPAASTARCVTGRRRKDRGCAPRASRTTRHVHHEPHHAHRRCGSACHRDGAIGGSRCRRRVCLRARRRRRAWQSACLLRGSPAQAVALLWGGSI